MNELTGVLPAHLTERPEVQDKTSMGKDDFMKLLMAQLQNQDPLNPMDHKEFGAQLAQFASLEKLTQIGDGIGKLEGGMGEEAKLQALGMIGKRVKASGAEISLVENQPTEIRLNTDGGFKPLKVSIYSGDGKLVREIDTDSKMVANKAVLWDGKTKDGDSAPSGKYLFRVAGMGQDGKSREQEANVMGKVIGVEMVDKNPLLLLDTANGQTKIEIAKVQNIASDEGEKKASDGKPAADATDKSKEKTNAASNTAIQSDDDLSSAWPRASIVDSGIGFMESKP